MTTTDPGRTPLSTCSATASASCAKASPLTTSHCTAVTPKPPTVEGECHGFAASAQAVLDDGHQAVGARHLPGLSGTLAPQALVVARARGQRQSHGHDGRGRQLPCEVGHSLNVIDSLRGVDGGALVEPHQKGPVIANVVPGL